MTTSIPTAGTLYKPPTGYCTDRYKLIRFAGDLESWELFNLEKDPYELDKR